LKLNNAYGGKLTTGKYLSQPSSRTLPSRGSGRAGLKSFYTAIPLLVAGALYALAMLMRHNVYAAIPLVLLGFAFYFPYYPTFWSIPTLILTESAAAATFGLINSVGQLGGLAGPYIIGRLNDHTIRSLPASHS
jgi:ACS family tartrate transporter-like MFS transporter